MYEIGASWPDVHKNLIIRARKYYGPWSWGQARRIEGRNDAGTDRAEAAGSSGRAGPYAEAGGGACPCDPPDPDRPGERQAAPLHADPDEDRQGLQRVPGGVGGGGVALIHPSAWKGNPANFALRGFSEVRYPKQRQR